MENEVLENEGKEVSALATVQDFGALSKSTSTKAELFTNITDQKKIFNLDSHVDNLLNDCEGELIRVKEVLIKRYEKPMKEPIYDEETGEILKDKEITMACILIDDNNKMEKKFFVRNEEDKAELKELLKKHLDRKTYNILKDLF